MHGGDGNLHSGSATSLPGNAFFVAESDRPCVQRRPDPKHYVHLAVIARAQAKTLGYTEPDPRDDLAGMDVARKVTILAR